MEQLVILIVIGLISLVNWILRTAAEKREEAKLKRVEQGGAMSGSQRNIYTLPPPSAPPVAARRRSAPGRDSFKELIEALGLPADQLPPPPVMARQAFQEEEFASLEEPVPPPVVKPPVKAPRWQAPSMRRTDDKTAQLARESAAAAGHAAASYRGTKLSDLLASRDAQRNAIVLSEIIGTPRGLAPAAHWPGVSSRWPVA